MTPPRLPERALSYLSACPPEGQRHAELLFTACQYRDAGIDQGTAERELVPLAVSYGQTQTEALHDVQSAYGKPARKPIGGGQPRREFRPPTPTRPAAKPIPVKADLARSADLPEPIADGFRVLLETCFVEGEEIGITSCELDGDGKSRPRDRGQTFNREWILSKLAEANGDVSRLWASTDKAGLLVRINPMTLNGATDADVTAWRHVLVECDGLELEKQLALYQQAELPIAALIYSGGKSLHALVRIEAADANQYAERVAYLFAALESHGVDPSTRNPSRHTRVPGAERGLTTQQLLAVNIGRKNFVEWQEWHEGSALTVDAERWIEAEPPPISPIVDGLFEAADKVEIVGSSKSRKSFFALQFALALASGKNSFLDWKIPRPVKVALVNCELKPAHFQRRLHHAAKRMGIAPIDIGGRLKVINTRGHVVTAEKLEAWTRNYGSQVLIVDPIYKLLDHDANESDSSAWRPILATFDHIAENLGAAVVFVHHNPKGRAGDRDARDRGAGSGVVARDYDSAIYLTEHKDQTDCIVVQTVTRNAAQREPFAIRFADRIFELADDVAPIEKTSTNSKPKVVVPQEAVTAALANGVSKSYGDLLAAVRRAGYTLHGSREAIASALTAGVISAEKQEAFPKKTIYSLTQRADPTGTNA